MVTVAEFLKTFNASTYAIHFTRFNQQTTCKSAMNGFIITWILHEIIIYSNKVNFVAG